MLNEVYRFRVRLDRLKEKLKPDQVDVMAAAKYLMDMIRVLGFGPDLLEEQTDIGSA